MKSSLQQINNLNSFVIEHFITGHGSSFKLLLKLPETHQWVITDKSILVIGSRREIENSGKSIFEILIPHFCYIQVIVFDLSYLPVAPVGT